MRKLLLIMAAALTLAVSAPQAVAQDAASLNELLRLIERGQSTDSAEARKREAEFNSRKSEQAQLLATAKAERTRAERTGAELEKLFETNGERLTVKQAELTERLGDLKELFGVLQVTSGDMQSVFGSSLTNIQFADREEFLVEFGGKMASSTNLASIEEIERLWYEMQREVVASGQIAKFTADVITDGEVRPTDVIRVGNFVLVADGRYLNFSTETEVITELPRQPQSRFVDTTTKLANAAPTDIVVMGIDPVRGGVLATLVDTATITEQVQQGGIVGYCIIALGIVGLIIALFLLVSLTAANSKVNRQLKNIGSPSDDNPLGRVLTAYTSNKSVDTETLELKLNEAVLKEIPKINRGLLLVKVIAAVAPLAGLLGTVTGMIKTFQVITLYGAGDPKLMAGGISQALMTTVLGLVVAIPMVLLHTVLSGRSKRLLGILQEQSAGLIAEHSEAAHKA